jgi:uncharacterized protein YhhL (DUF1145 family)
MNNIWPIAKLILLGLYISAAISRFVPAMAGYSNILIGLAFLLLAVHLIEFLVLKDKLNAHAPGKNHFLPTLLFGVAHTKPLFANEKI